MANVECSYGLGNCIVQGWTACMPRGVGCAVVGYRKSGGAMPSRVVVTVGSRFNGGVGCCCGVK